MKISKAINPEARRIPPTARILPPICSDMEEDQTKDPTTSNTHMEINMRGIHPTGLNTSCESCAIFWHVYVDNLR
jgi:hypothetical protein